MNLSAVLEVAIGLVLLYYALGLIVNAIVGTVKEVFDMRAEALEQVLVKFLETEGDKLALFNRFKNSPLIQSLKPLAPKLRQIKNRADPKISEIPNPTFALAILEALSSEHLVLIGVQRGIGELAKGVAAGDQTTQALLNSLVDIGDQQRLVEGMQKAIGQIPDKNIQERLKNLVTVLLGTPAQQLDVIRAGIRGLPEGIAKKALTGLIDFSVTDIDEARKRIEAWYDNLMQNVSQLFTKNVQRIVIGVSLAVTLIIGTDTIYVARVLWEQPSLRAAIAAAVPQFVDEYGAGQISPQEAANLSPEQRIAVIRDRVESVNKVVLDLDQLGIPITWGQSPLPQDVPGWLLKALGLLITAAATSQGSSFWYDILKKINPQSKPPAGESS